MSPELLLVIATFGLVAATFCLFVATGMLVRDGTRKSAEQIKRWAEEDKRRAQEAEPTAVVELATRPLSTFDIDLFFACFNLGNNTFFVDRLIVTTSDGTRDESDLTPKIVLPGTYVTIGYDLGQIMGAGQEAKFKEANCVLILKGATGAVATDPVWFYVSHYAEGKYDWRPGRLAERQPGMVVKAPKVLLNSHVVNMQDANVLDEYGSNAAVRCPECGNVFIFSMHLNRKRGRSCPHCSLGKAILSENGIRITKGEDDRP